MRGRHCWRRRGGTRKGKGERKGGRRGELDRESRVCPLEEDKGSESDLCVDEDTEDNFYFIKSSNRGRRCLRSCSLLMRHRPRKSCRVFHLKTRTVDTILEYTNTKETDTWGQYP